MDFFSTSTRRVNLAGGVRGAPSAASRADSLEQARRERQQRQQLKRREQAAANIQVTHTTGQGGGGEGGGSGRDCPPTFWTNRHQHKQEQARQRAAWDAELRQLVEQSKSGAALPAESLLRCIRRFFFFSPLAHTRTGQAAAKGQRAKEAASVADADLARFRQLVPLLLTSLRSADRQQHLGALLLAQGATSTSSSTAASTPSRLPAAASSWLYALRKVCLVLLQQLQQTQSQPIERVGSDLLLLWQLLDCNQWPLVKTAGQATPSEKALIVRTQAALVSSMVSGSSYDSQPQARTLDLFQAMRVRILDLTFIQENGALTDKQQKAKTSVALLFATVLRCVAIMKQAYPDAPSSSSAPSPLRPVLTSFVYHILSIPALPQRLRQFGLQALVSSFLSPPIFDSSMQTLAGQLEELNVAAAANAAAAYAQSHTLSFARSAFHSVSHTWHDAVAAHASVSSSAAAPATAYSEDMESDAAPLVRSSSTPAASTSAYFFPPPQERAPLSVSGVAWILGNCLELVSGLDESKSAAASHSFSCFLAALEQLIQAVPEHEFPTAEGGKMSPPPTAAASLSLLPLALVKQFEVLSQRSFLDRLCRRLLADASTPSPAPSPDASVGPVSSPSVASSSPSSLRDIPIVSALIDSILFKWSASSNSILNTIVFSSDIVPRLWKAVEQSGLLDRIQKAAKDTSTAQTAANANATALTLERMLNDRFFPLLPLFCTLYTHLLLVLDDDEFFLQQRPFSLTEDVSRMVSTLKLLLYHLYWSRFTTDDTHTRLRERFTQLFVQLRERQSRRPFMPAEAWLFSGPTLTVPLQTLQSELSEQEERQMDLGLDDHQSASLLAPSRSSSLLSSLPFVLPFSDRVHLLYSHIESDKQRVQSGGMVHFAHGLGRRIRIRRSTVLEDGFESIFGLSPSDLKGRLQVEFTDEHGIVEAGLDGGGLFKEFLTTLLKTAFDPKLNLFVETEQHFLYPNPYSLDLPLKEVEGMSDNDEDDPRQQHESLTLNYYRFLGSMIGKALYEGIQIESQFALFFLRYCVCLPNYIDELQGLDQELYSSLMKIKTFPAEQDITELGLTFSVDRRSFGVTRTVELVPGGADMPVTHDNKVRFVYMLTDYYLNRQMHKQAAAFQQGLASVIQPVWLRMFAAEEIRLLISGSSAINVDDLQAHTAYGSGYSAQHELVQWFWQLLREMSSDELANLLRFATSCSRAPLLGFQSLNPRFCLQRVNIDEQENMLPSASTCMNLLRVPRYSSKQRLKEKLLYAINSASHGFALT